MDGAKSGNSDNPIIFRRQVSFCTLQNGFCSSDTDKF